VLLAAVAAVVVVVVLSVSGSNIPNASKADCVSVGTSIQSLRRFESLVRRPIDCVLVFSNAAPDWARWERPWFLPSNHPGPDYAWGAWATAPGTHRQLVISQNLFPSELNGSDWLDAGAAGAYEQYARALARNLVAAGLGRSVIRLAHEANDTTGPYALPSSDRGLALWRRFWRRTVLAMRSVPGAHFLFDWCILASGRPIPLKKWYPGDDVVDIVGLDAYDGGVPEGVDRWTWIYRKPDGIRDVLRFAQAHHKPASLPEWGLEPADADSLGGGDDPAYVDHIADVVKNNRVAYQSYFYHLDSERVFDSSPLSRAAYRRHFGGGGDAAGAGTVTVGPWRGRSERP
jgi:Glycosyl hydrolase family 26